LEIHDLGLYTTARPLADERLAARLRSRRDLRRLLVPLFSGDGERHDSSVKVPGALAQTMLGLRRWVRLGGEVGVWLLPSRAEMAGLGPWVRRLACEGVKEVLLAHREQPPGWGGLSLEDCPGLKSFAEAAAEAARAASETGLSLSVFGLPACLWDGRLAPRHELRALYDETISGASSPESCRARRRPRMAFGAACGTCSRKASCDGVRGDFLARYGEEDLHAV